MNIITFCLSVTLLVTLSPIDDRYFNFQCGAVRAWKNIFISGTVYKPEMRNGIRHNAPTLYQRLFKLLLPFLPVRHTTLK